MPLCLRIDEEYGPELVAEEEQVDVSMVPMAASVQPKKVPLLEPGIFQFPLLLLLPGRDTASSVRGQPERHPWREAAT